MFQFFSNLKKSADDTDEAATPIKVALLGSCVTRDLFNSKFNPDYKNLFQVVADQQHMSMISLMSIPLPIREKTINGDVSDFYKNVYRQDLQKDFLKRLKNSDPDILILDFYTDVFYGALEVNNMSFITNKKWQYEKLSHFENILINKEYSIYNESDQFIDLWKTSFDIFYDYLRKNLPNCRIVINKARFINVGKSYGEDFILSATLEDKWEKFHIDRFNILWDLFDTYASCKYNLQVINFKKDKYYCPADHPWGWFYVHYNREYYMNTLQEIKRLLLSL
ncbi:DUF6270 domain-containing protein [Enterococcus casseliflavus]|nr:DUF6270 domain-containing protein [Enterococcus casseliflavus]